MSTPSTESPSIDFMPRALVDGRVYQLGGEIALDERVSWASSSIPTTQPVNCYLIKGDGGSILVDTGVRLHQEVVVEQLETLLHQNEPLSILLTRTEMECCLNIPAIEARFHVERVWYTGGITVPRSSAHAKRFTVEPGTTMTQDLGHGLVMEIISPLLRLLPTLWIYDPVSGVILTSDAFTHGPGEDVQKGLQKFEWFNQADTRPIASDVLQVFERRGVAAIGPGYGAPIDGAERCRRAAVQLAEAIREGGIR